MIRGSPACKKTLMTYYSLAGMCQHVKLQSLHPADKRQSIAFDAFYKALQLCSSQHFSRNSYLMSDFLQQHKKRERVSPCTEQNVCPLAGKTLAGLLLSVMPKFYFAVFFPWGGGRCGGGFGRSGSEHGKGIEVLQRFSFGAQEGTRQGAVSKEFPTDTWYYALL